jgi:hypothetical protein
MEDLKRFKETHGHANVTIREDIPLGQFCAKARYAHNNPGKGTKLTDERISAFNAMDFNWTSQEYVTRSFDERIDDLEKYKRTHGHLSVNRHKDSSLYQLVLLRRQTDWRAQRISSPFLRISNNVTTRFATALAFATTILPIPHLTIRLSSSSDSSWSGTSSNDLDNWLVDELRTKGGY